MARLIYYRSFRLTRSTDTYEYRTSGDCQSNWYDMGDLLALLTFRRDKYEIRCWQNSMWDVGGLTCLSPYYISGRCLWGAWPVTAVLTSVDWVFLHVKLTGTLLDYQGMCVWLTFIVLYTYVRVRSPLLISPNTDARYDVSHSNTTAVSSPCQNNPRDSRHVYGVGQLHL